MRAHQHKHDMEIVEKMCMRRMLSWPICRCKGSKKGDNWGAFGGEKKRPMEIGTVFIEMLSLNKMNTFVALASAPTTTNDAHSSVLPSNVVICVSGDLM